MRRETEKMRQRIKIELCEVPRKNPPDEKKSICHKCRWAKYAGDTKVTCLWRECVKGGRV